MMKSEVKKYVFGELCVTCGKRVYTHCEYVHGKKELPPCRDGKPLHRAFLAGLESTKERQAILVEACKTALEDTEMLLNEECEFCDENLQATIDVLRKAVDETQKGNHE